MTLHVSEALTRNALIVDGLVFGGDRPDWLDLGSVELQEPVTLRSQTFTHAAVRRLQTNEEVRLGEEDGLVEFNPTLLLSLQIGPDSNEEDLKTSIHYAKLALTPPYLTRPHGTLPKGDGLIIPRRFAAFRSWGDTDLEYGGGALGTPIVEDTEAGYMAAETIGAVATTVRTLGYGALTLARRDEAPV